jgi:hypothetical protein
VDGRLVLLGLIVVVAAGTARDLRPLQTTAENRARIARERAADQVLVEVDRAQQCRMATRGRYAATVPSLQFTGGSFMRIALRHHLDIQLAATAGGRGYVQRVTGLGVDAVLERRGTRLVRLDVGDRRPPALATGCSRAR